MNGRSPRNKKLASVGKFQDLQHCCIMLYNQRFIALAARCHLIFSTAFFPRRSYLRRGASAGGIARQIRRVEKKSARQCQQRNAALSFSSSSPQKQQQLSLRILTYAHTSLHMLSILSHICKSFSSASHIKEIFIFNNLQLSANETYIFEICMTSAEK